MAGTSAKPPDPRHRPLGEAPVETGWPSSPREPDGGEGIGGEHTGPVAIARHVKDDGRALILYARDRHGRR